MSIEINGQAGGGVARNAERGEASASRTEASPAQQQTGQSSTGDTVSLTQTAAQLQSLQNSLAELPVVDTQRVESIRQAIADGSYEIDAGRIADGILAFE